MRRVMTDLVAAAGVGVAPRDAVAAAAATGLHPEPGDGARSEHVVLRGPPHGYRLLRARLAGAPPHLRQRVRVLLVFLTSVETATAPRPLRRLLLAAALRRSIDGSVAKVIELCFVSTR